MQIHTQTLINREYGETELLLWMVKITSGAEDASVWTVLWALKDVFCSISPDAKSSFNCLRSCLAFFFIVAGKSEITRASRIIPENTACPCLLILSSDCGATFYLLWLKYDKNPFLFITLIFHHMNNYRYLEMAVAEKGWDTWCWLCICAGITVCVYDLFFSPAEELSFGSVETERRSLIILSNVAKNQVAFKVSMLPSQLS